MKLSGVSIVRNGVKLGYPFIQAIQSVLPICGEFIVAVGDSTDETREQIEKINDKRIKIIDTVWDLKNRTGGTILSEQTNLAMAQAQGEWIFYIQADEAVHDKDYEKIMGAIETAKNMPDVDGLAFNYLHFYGSYFTIQTGRNWYKQEVRIVRNKAGIVSHGDAQGFRKNGKKIKAINCGARVFHYGWARPPEIMLEKIKSFHAFWHDDVWIGKNCKSDSVKDYFSDLGNLKPYKGDHPFAMNTTINHDNDLFINACRHEYLKRRTLRDKIKDFIRSFSIGQHRNFILVKR